MNTMFWPSVSAGSSYMVWAHGRRHSLPVLLLDVEDDGTLDLAIPPASLRGRWRPWRLDRHQVKGLFSLDPANAPAALQLGGPFRRQPAVLFCSCESAYCTQHGGNLGQLAEGDIDPADGSDPRLFAAPADSGFTPSCDSCSGEPTGRYTMEWLGDICDRCAAVNAGPWVRDWWAA